MSDNRQEVTVSSESPSVTESWLGRHGPYVLLLAYLFYGLEIATDILGGWWELADMLPIMSASIVVLFGAAMVRLATRVGLQLKRRTPLGAILRDILGEPRWWRTWYPRALRDRASIWERLPWTLRVTRTALWLGLLVLPAGILLNVLVIPTFEAVYGGMGLPLPFMMRTFASLVTTAGYMLSPLMVAALAQGLRWRAQHGLSAGETVSAMFSANEDFWRDSEASELLTS